MVLNFILVPIIIIPQLKRIRRTATAGMINLANIGIEDYMNETFVEYSNGLYNFEQLKTEMDFIRGKTKKRGKVNLYLK